MSGFGTPHQNAEQKGWRRSKVQERPDTERTFLAGNRRSSRPVEPEPMAPSVSVTSPAEPPPQSASPVLLAVSCEGRVFAAPPEPGKASEGSGGEVPRKSSRLQVAKGDQVSAGSKGQGELLVEAAMFGNAASVVQLLDGGVSVDTVDDSGYTSLHWAVVNHHGGVLSTLLQRGANVNIQDSAGYTPLHHAVRRGIVEYVALLLEHHADPTLKTASGHTALKICTSKPILQQLQRAKKNAGKGAKGGGAGGDGRPADAALLRDLEELEELEREIDTGEAEIALQEREYKRAMDDMRARRRRLQRLEQELRDKEAELNKREAILEQLRDRQREGDTAPMSEDDMLAQVLPVVQFDEMRILSTLGRGGFATVYRAQWLGDEVAVKRLADDGDAEELQRSFRAETLLLSKMRHPNIVLVVGASGGQQCAIVTELMARGDLYSHLQDPESPLADGDLGMQIAADIARGMNYLHRLEPPMIHRDLKSCNILIDDRWRAKVSDFGTTKSRTATMIQTVNAVGTPAWMAPECLRGDKFDEKSDVYSFGVILWELMYRRVPWHGMEPLQVIGAVGFRGDRLSFQEPTRWPRLPNWCIQLALSCYAEPEHRPSFESILKTFRKEDVI